MKQRITPFFTFNGRAEEAMNFYTNNLPDAKILKLEKYSKNNNPMFKEGDENRVFTGLISFLSQEIMFLDMTAAYPAPEFTWANSLLVDCKSEEEFDSIFKTLSTDGQVMMGPEPVAHFRKGAWVVDKFGVVWQLVWE
ncbi:MAG: VOC family protein [Alphaproteobacteria bacterium]|jgi:predicted 3-demethylubiquinone-9 3-methyltransferase (glyoxalase superfamily)|nr:VOC family protein [Alphaproteobacteria bacterium]